MGKPKAIYDSFRPKWRPAIYTFFYPKLERVANKYGYALALHGSLRDDMDLVAVPWVEETGDIEAMIGEMQESIGARHRFIEQEPTHKPHGRIAYSIATGSGSRIDLSIMPKISGDSDG